MTITQPEELAAAPGDTPPPTTSRPARVGRGGWPIWVAGLIVLVVVAVGLLIWHQRSMPDHIVGGALVKGQVAAPTFALTDQLGGTTSLNTYKGQPVALTFLYTNCPDVCPLIASNLHETYKLLGSDATHVGILAVTVDPEHDTVDKVREFSDARGLTDQWRFLVGNRDQLTPIWKAYGIAAQPETPSTRPISPAEQQQDRGLPPSPDIVEHSAPIFLIDKAGNLRAMLPVDVTPDTLATDMRVLLSES